MKQNKKDGEWSIEKMNAKARKFVVLLGLSFITLTSGCAFGKFGPADFNDGITLPPGIQGKNKAAIVKIMGVPDSTVTFEGADYWRYGNKKGVYILFFGKTEAKDIILKFEEGIVAQGRMVDKGSSTGVLVGQGSVAN